MDTRAYLDRIGYRGPLTPTAETLRALQVAHLQTVPFENLSIHARQPIVLDDESLFDKVVTRRRGGFCYELNGLFAALLRALGFRVTMLSAAAARADGTFGPEFDHMALLVTLLDEGERWLADVGFGDSFRDPLRLDERREQPEGRRAFRIDEDGGHLLLLRRDGAGEPWQSQYRFTLQPHEYPDYAGMCHYHQTSLGVALHPADRLLPGDAGGSRHLERDEADHLPQQRAAGAAPRERRGAYGAASRAVRRGGVRVLTALRKSCGQKARA